MELGCGLSKWNGPYLFFYYVLLCFFTYSMQPHQDYGIKDYPGPTPRY